MKQASAKQGAKTMTPFLIFRTVLIVMCGAAFVRLLEGHPVGILAMGLSSIAAFIWLLIDLHNLALAGARAMGG
jgi:hypothetical protein